MSDLPDLDYTVNDPTSVTCPHCHGPEFDVSDELAGLTEWTGKCPICDEEIYLEVQHEVTVLAWKPGALH